MRYARGAGWAGMLIAFVNTLTFAKVWQETFIYYGISPTIIYVALPITYLVACWTIGYIDEVKDLWKAEYTYTNKLLNKEWCELSEKIDLINSKIDNITYKIEEQPTKIDEYKNDR